MLRKLEKGNAVVFMDSHGERIDALVTDIFGTPQADGMFRMEPGYAPCVNVVFVVKDEKKTDTYGRQIARETSVVHRVSQPAGRYCFLFPDEVA